MQTVRYQTTCVHSSRNNISAHDRAQWGAESKEGRIVDNTETLLNLTNQNRCIQMTCTADYDRDKGQTRPLVREGAPHRQNYHGLTVTKIWAWTPEEAWHQERLADWPSVVMWLTC
jgi:hypothetical protein